MLAQYLKRGSHNVVAYTTSSVFVRGLGFFFLPYFLSQLTLYEFGIWDFYQLFFSMGTMLLTSCAATGMIRFFLLHRDDEMQQRKAVGNAVWAVLAGALLLPVLFGLLRAVWPSLVASPYLGVTLLNVCFFAPFSMVLAYARMREYLVRYCVLFCGQNLLATALTVFLVSRGYGVWAFFYASGFSYFIFSPLFVVLLYRHRLFCRTLFKEQVLYSLPLLAYGFLYTGFYSLDRFFITYKSGFDALGAYGVLGRFGAIFQFFAIALMDAWPVVLFNAQKEKNGDALIAKLVSYFLMVLTTGGLVSIVASSWAMHRFLAAEYFGIARLLAIYFLPLVLLEVARLLQVGFALSKKTFLSPVAALFGLSMQALSLWLLQGRGLAGVMLANTGAFVGYGVLSFVMSGKSYNRESLDGGRTVRVMALFVCYALALHRFFLAQHVLQQLLLLFSWPLALWLSGVVTPEEKEWVKKKAGWWRDPLPSKNILYLRTDINFEEIKAGGSVAHTLGVIQGFKTLGYNVLCASSSMQSTLTSLDLPYFQELKVYPFFVFLRWKLGHLRWRLDCFCANLFFTLQLLKIFRKNQVAFIYQRYSILNCVGLILSKLKKIPLVLEYNGSEVWVFNTWSEHRWFTLTRLSTFIERLNVRYADYLVVVSQPIKDDLVTRGVAAEKILVNPNGVDPELFDPQGLARQREEMRAALSLQEKLVFGFVGTFSYWHGIEVLAHLIPAVAAKYRQAHFLLIGDGPLKNYLMTELSKNPQVLQQVTFTGLVPQQAAKNYLAACDAFLCPTQPNKDGTRFFGSPTKIFEYMSLGKPIIASDLEQLGELLAPAVTVENLQHGLVENRVGILVRPDDRDGFVAAACAVVEAHENARAQLGTNARAKVIEQYSWKKHVEHLQTWMGNHGA